MILLKLSEANQRVVLELVRKSESPNWLFVFDYQDTNKPKIKGFQPPVYSSMAFTEFSISLPEDFDLKKGDYVLNVFEKDNQDDTSTEGLKTSYTTLLRVVNG
jgi:hypothetical protein